MRQERQGIIKQELESGTGASIAMEMQRTKVRMVYRIWFSDLEKQHGPLALIKPFGLRGYRVQLTFGRFARRVIDRIGLARPEEIDLARALVSTIHGQDVFVEFGDQTEKSWVVAPGFRITATARKLSIDPVEAISRFCREIVTPLMAAMAELIGYEQVDETISTDHAMEGKLRVSIIQQRERNPRNRLLCLKIHGNRCVVCGLRPQSVYGEAGSIIEVHHIEALSCLAKPRKYDPRIDLVPLCPNCHRAVHTRRPYPLTLEELRGMIKIPTGDGAAI